MRTHEVVTTDEVVRGHPGTVARCSCGWISRWWVRDGSAESDAHQHRMSEDDAYREQRKARVAEHNAREKARSCTCERSALDFVYTHSDECPIHRIELTPSLPMAPPIRCHGCSCHLHPPCGYCENCKHFDDPDCKNDCQDCEENHD